MAYVNLKMMRWLFLLVYIVQCCVVFSQNTGNLILPSGLTIEDRIATPEGYTRIYVQDSSYAHYLRHIPLKPNGSLVKYYNGDIKYNTKPVYCAVVDMPISQRDLQQCADAVMRLRAEYFYGLQQYDNIHFNFLSDGKPRFYTNYAKGDYSYGRFMKYMDYVFAFANTASLYHEMVAVNIYDMQIGDVFIQKGNPYGHAVIVVDMAVNSQGKKVYLLAQSYMPAQETQILVNPTDSKLSPWYLLNNEGVVTPEWNFQANDLRRFKTQTAVSKAAF